MCACTHTHARIFCLTGFFTPVAQACMIIGATIDSPDAFPVTLSRVSKHWRVLKFRCWAGHDSHWTDQQTSEKADVTLSFLSHPMWHRRPAEYMRNIYLNMYISVCVSNKLEFSSLKSFLEPRSRNYTMSQKTSHLWLAVILTHTIWLQ